MSHATPSNTMMPPAETMAAQAIGRLAADGYTSSLMRLARPLLNELGRRLVEPGSKRSDTIAWLEERGVEMPDRNVDRFAQRFRETYKKIVIEWGDKRLVAELSADPAFSADDLQRLIKNRTTWLFAQEVMAANPGDLDNGRASNILSLIIAADKAKLEQEKFALATRQASDRAAKLTAEVYRMQVETEQKRLRIDERVKALQTRIDDLSKRAERGQIIDPSVFQKIRDDLTGVAA